jgi:hemerythrin
MSYEWDPSLETGYIKIDNQHMELISTLNKLIDASQMGRGRDVIIKALTYLTEYTVTHFEMEEGLMLMYNYQDYNAHKKLHDEFKETVKGLSKRLFDEGPTLDMVNIVTTTIGNWLVSHIKGDDYQMAVYIKSKDTN